MEYKISFYSWSGQFRDFNLTLNQTQSYTWSSKRKKKNISTKCSILNYNDHKNHRTLTKEAMRTIPQHVQINNLTFDSHF